MIPLFTDIHNWWSVKYTYPCYSEDNSWNSSENKNICVPFTIHLEPEMVYRYTVNTVCL